MIALVTHRAAARGHPRRIDILSVPLLGTFLCWRYARLVLQTPVLFLTLVMIAHAFWGPSLAPKNLATLLTWVHFRGMVVLATVFAGNLFCMACPFMLPRTLARRWFAPRLDWPRRLRNKWPSVVLFVLVLFAFELFDLWAEPWWTGVLIVAYFSAALTCDALFRRASFCKYVCPIGQFNFVASTLSPLEVAVRDQAICSNCRTKDCIRGRAATEASGPATTRSQLPIVQRGCEMALFQPRKVGNLDCTFCLDCVHACPHDNVGVLLRLPADELTIGGARSGLGKVDRRFDFTALMTIFTFGAMLNAFAMISPVYALEQWIAGLTELRVEWPILGAMFLILLVIEPALLLLAVAAAARRFAGLGESLPSIINRYACSLVPMGFGIWLAHYGFHFFTGFLTVIPVAQNSVEESFGWPWLGEPLWQLGGLPEAMVSPLEIGFLSLGLLGSWIVAWSITRGSARCAVWAGFLPWATLHMLLFVTAWWIMSQPMDMRGTFLGG